MDNDTKLLLGMDLTINYCEDCTDAYLSGIEPGETACDEKAQDEKKEKNA